MNNVAISLMGEPEKEILEGLPDGVKCHLLQNAQCYHINLDKREYIIFQRLDMLPYTCWYTQYLFRSPKIFRCEMESNDVEFHSLLEGKIIYHMDESNILFNTSAGNHNILVNPPVVTKTCFPYHFATTFDIHVTPIYFKELMQVYPAFKQLDSKLESGKMGTLFPDHMQGHNELLIKINLLLRQLGSNHTTAAQVDANYKQQLDEIIALFAEGVTENKKGQQHPIKADIINRILDTGEYLTKEFLNNNAVADAKKRFGLSAALLNKYFPMVYDMKPKEFLLNKKIKAAINYMNEFPNENLTEISMSAGFKDVKHFKDRFKTVVGISVKQYREANVKAEVKKAPLPIN